MTPLQGGYYPHFTDEENEAQTGDLTKDTAGE